MVSRIWIGWGHAKGVLGLETKMGANDGYVCKIGNIYPCKRLLDLVDQKGGFGIGVLGIIEGTDELAESSLQRS